MSRFKYVCDYKESNRNFKIYEDTVTNEYYKVNDEISSKVEYDEIKEAIKLNDLFRKKKNKKKPMILTTIGALALIKMLSLYDQVEENLTRDNEILVTDEATIDKAVNSDNSLRKIGRKDYLVKAIKENKTIKDHNIDEYIDVLLRIDIDDVDYLLLASKFRNYNFNNEEITKEELKELLNLNDYGFVASELYCYVHKTQNVPQFAMISDIFTGDDDILKRLFGREKLEDVLYEKIGAEVNIYEANNDENVINAVLKKREEYNVYSGVLRNNIFNEFICLSNNGGYDVFFKETNGYLEDVTYEVNTYELLKKVNAIDTFDYRVADDRKILYFYASANLNGVFLNDVTNEILAGAVNGSISQKYLDLCDLFGFLSAHDYNFNYYKLISLADLSMYSDAIPLLEEVNLCLKEEVRENNLTEEQYQAFLNSVYSELKEHNNGDYELFLNANVNNESIGEFTLELKKGL